MPIMKVTSNGRVIGYRWGHHGYLYTTREHGESARDLAWQQGMAIKASQGRLIRVKKRRRDGVAQRYTKRIKNKKIISPNVRHTGGTV